MQFDEEHQVWLQQHMERRRGERRNRLERGHGHAERLFLRQVWWPLRGHLHQLHPEFEVADWRNRPYFADFAWLPGSGVKLIIEIKGYATHVRDMDRQKYSSELNRETFLYGVGYDVISFSYDDVARQPELVMMLLRIALGRYQAEHAPTDKPGVMEKEIIRLLIQLARPILPKDVAEHLGVDPKTARRMLRKLSEKGWLRPVRRGKSQRIVRYEWAKGTLEYFA